MNIDLTAAIEAAARERYERVRRGRGQAHLGEMPAWHNLSPVHQYGWREGVLDEIAAAAPLIAAQVAEQIARAIEAERTDVLLDSDGADTRTDWLASGLARAARIAREAVR